MAQTGAGNRKNAPAPSGGGSSMLRNTTPSNNKPTASGGGASVLRSTKPPVPAGIARMAPVAPKAPASIARMAAPQQQSFVGGGTGGGGGGIATDVPVGSAPVSEDDYLAGDSSFQLQLAALMKALQDGTADLAGQRTRYDTDYNDAVKGLGWIQDDANTADVNESRWNFEDQNTAAGRAFQNQNNDFASRGLLQSSLYGTANDNLTRSLNDQLGSVNTAKTNFFDDLTKKETSLKSENQLSSQQARAEALARRAAGIQL